MYGHQRLGLPDSALERLAPRAFLHTHSAHSISDIGSEQGRAKQVRGVRGAVTADIEGQTEQQQQQQQRQQTESRIIIRLQA